MTADSWLDANRPAGPLRHALRLGVERPLLQRGAVRSAIPHSKLLIERVGAGAMLAAELRCPCVPGARITLIIESDGLDGALHSWTLDGTGPLACEVLRPDQPLSFTRSLRIWVSSDSDLPWVAVEIAIAPPALADTERVHSIASALKTTERVAFPALRTTQRCAMG